MHTMETRYFSCVRDLPSDWDSRASFDRYVKTLDRTSSPGWPLCKEANTNGKWLYPNDTLEPDPARAEMLWQMVQQVMAGEFDHIFKLFIKPEAHKKEKAEAKRWRLIMAAALPVQIAWKMTIGHLEEALLAEQPFIPPAYGEVFFGGGWRRFSENCRRKKITWATDKKSWDWNSPGWVYLACRDLRVSLTRNHTPKWLKVLFWLYADAYQHSKVLLSTGDVYEQLTAGLMKSGVPPTISDNSISQDLLSCAASLSVGEEPPPKKITGDDVLQKKPKEPDRYLERLQTFGCVVKEAVDKMEFMGFSFEKTIEPIYKSKHVWNVSHQQDENLEGVLDAYCRLYAHQPDFLEFWIGVGRRLGIVLKTPAFYRYFMDNPNALKSQSFGTPVYRDLAGVRL
nr:hypothetical protein 2 [Hubei sobemo-like virus 40]